MELKDKLQVENSVKRKQQVKKVAIGFFSLMLILTFFSNTIMNYSLPQIAAKQVEEGVIELGVEGSGMVEVVSEYVNTKEDAKANMEIDMQSNIYQIESQQGEQIKGELEEQIKEQIKEQVESKIEEVKKEIEEIENKLGNNETTKVDNVLDNNKNEDSNSQLDIEESIEPEKEEINNEEKQGNSYENESIITEDNGQEKIEKEIKQVTIFVKNTLDDRITVGMQGKIEAPVSAKHGKAILKEIIQGEDGMGSSLVFEIQEVEVAQGQSMTISLNKKEYSCPQIVPTSAVRIDKNGAFVFVLEMKNSPLGNRYFVNKVPVTVEAQGVGQTAILGMIEKGDYVVTISEDILESGQQVRLKEE